MYEYGFTDFCYPGPDFNGSGYIYCREAFKDESETVGKRSITEEIIIKNN